MGVRFVDRDTAAIVFIGTTIVICMNACVESQRCVSHIANSYSLELILSITLIHGSKISERCRNISSYGYSFAGDVYDIVFYTNKLNNVYRNLDGYKYWVKKCVFRDNYTMRLWQLNHQEDPYPLQMNMQYTYVQYNGWLCIIYRVVTL